MPLIRLDVAGVFRNCYNSRIDCGQSPVVICLQFKIFSYFNAIELFVLVAACVWVRLCFKREVYRLSLTRKINTLYDSLHFVMR